MSIFNITLLLQAIKLILKRNYGFYSVTISNTTYEYRMSRWLPDSLPPVVLGDTSSVNLLETGEDEESSLFPSHPPLPSSFTRGPDAKVNRPSICHYNLMKPPNCYYFLFSRWLPSEWNEVQGTLFNDQSF